MQVTDCHYEVLCVQECVHSGDIRHVCKSWKSSESSRDVLILKQPHPPAILWHFPIKRRGCVPPSESGLSAGLTQTTAESCSASLQKLYQFLGPGLKNRAVSTSCLLGHSLLNPATVLWRSLNGPVKRPRHRGTVRQHPVHSSMNEPSWKEILHLLDSCPSWLCSVWSRDSHSHGALPKWQLREQNKWLLC